MRLKQSPKRTKKEISLLGAVHIGNAVFFVYKNFDGNIKLRMGNEEKIQEKLLRRMIELNPRIKKIMNSYKLKPAVNAKTLNELSGGHMNDTCKVAIGIYSFLPETIRKTVNFESIKEASMLHDMGKALIPSKILNKPAKLNRKERKIMNIHSTLGYELLKTQSIKSETLGLIKFHHQNLQHSGYPLITESQNVSDLGVQIVSVADKYSALRERRVYRRKLSRAESLLILYKEVLEGKIKREIYNALFKYAETCDNQ